MKSSSTHKNRIRPGLWYLALWWFLAYNSRFCHHLSGSQGRTDDGGVSSKQPQLVWAVSTLAWFIFLLRGAYIVWNAVDRHIRKNFLHLAYFLSNHMMVLLFRHTITEVENAGGNLISTIAKVPQHGLQESVHVLGSDDLLSDTVGITNSTIPGSLDFI